MRQSGLAIWSDEKAKVWMDPKAMERNTVVVASAPLYLSFSWQPSICFPRQPFPAVLSIQVLPLELAAYPSQDLIRSGESEHRIPCKVQTSDSGEPVRHVSSTEAAQREECALSWCTWIKANRAQKRDPTERSESSSFCAVGGWGMFSDTQLSTMGRGSALLERFEWEGSGIKDNSGTNVSNQHSVHLKLPQH